MHLVTKNGIPSLFTQQKGPTNVVVVVNKIKIMEDCMRLEISDGDK